MTLKQIVHTEQMLSHHSVESNQANDVVEHHFRPSDAMKHGVPAAIILHSMRWWITHRRANGHEPIYGHHWCYMSVKAWSELLPYLTIKQIYNTLNKLERDGEIRSEKLEKANWRTVKWYTIPDEFAVNSKHKESEPLRSINIKNACEFGIDAALVMKEINYWLENSEFGREFRGVTWVKVSREKVKRAIPFLNDSRIKNTLIKVKRNPIYFVQQLDWKSRVRPDWIAAVSSITASFDNAHEEAILLNESDHLTDKDVAKVRDNLVVRNKRKGYVSIDSLEADKYPNSLVAQEMITQMKDSGYRVYDGPLKRSCWDLIEASIELVGDWIWEYMLKFMEYNNYKKLVSLTDMFDVEFQGIDDFEDYITKVANYWRD